MSRTRNGIKPWKRRYQLSSKVRCATKRLDYTLIEHRVGDLDEAGDVGALHVVHELAVGSVLHAGGVDRLHDSLEAGVDLFAAPVQVHRVLRHLQAAGRNPACIRRLAGAEEDL